MWLRVSNNVIFLGAIGIVVVAILLGSTFLFSQTKNNSQPFLSPTLISPGNNIMRENTLQGTTGWKIPDGQTASTQIQAYANATSVQPGQQITFYVSTQVEGTPYSIGIYRLGWYGGAGGRLKFLVGNQIGHAQGYYDPSLQIHKLVNCTSCHIDTKMGLIEANWKPSYTLTVPSDWVTGIYLAKFADAYGMQTYVTFDVRGNDHSTFLVVTPDTTNAAYNIWGGYSLYESDKDNSSVAALEKIQLPKAVKVSFDRPYLNGYGPWYVLGFEADTIYWMERQGYDLSYISDVDMHKNPQQLLQHRVYLSLGHDEYWTKQMYDGVAYARNHGVSLAFLGANEIYWQMRFEPDSAGVPDRTIVCYKVETDLRNLAQDPLYGKDNSLVTSQWRDPVVNRPENALVGIMYSSLTHKQLGFPWSVSSKADSPLLTGTGLVPGILYGCGLVGYEWDRIFNNGLTPKGLQIIGRSSTETDYLAPDSSNTTYYIAPSGAMVFAAGSIYWGTALDSYRLITDKLCSGQQLVVPGIQKLMVNVMAALVSHSTSSQK
jgi:hypothetical protein